MDAIDNKSPMEGIYFDELSKIRVLDTEKSTDTQALRDECKNFLEHIDTFHGTVGSLVDMMLELRGAVEQQKLKAIGARNVVATLGQQRQAEKLQLQAEIADRQAKLERLRVEYDAINKVLYDQEHLIESLVTQK